MPVPLVCRTVAAAAKPRPESAPGRVARKAKKPPTKELFFQMKTWDPKISEYVDEYTRKPLGRRQHGGGRHASSARKVKAPFIGNSTHRQDYTEKKLPPGAGRGPERQTEFVSAGPFSGKSTYRDTYTPKEFEKRAAREPEEFVSAGPFVGSSTYRDTYTPKELQTRENFVPQGEGSFEPAGKFDGSTTYRDTYTPKGVQRREAFRPKDEGGFEPGAKFDAASTYRDTYTPKELAPRR